MLESLLLGIDMIAMLILVVWSMRAGTEQSNDKK